MLGFNAVSESAIAEIPDELTGNISASGTLVATVNVVTNDPVRDLFVAFARRMIYAVELFPQPLSDR